MSVSHSFYSNDQLSESLDDTSDTSEHSDEKPVSPKVGELSWCYLPPSAVAEADYRVCCTGAGELELTGNVQQGRRDTANTLRIGSSREDDHHRSHSNPHDAALRASATAFQPKVKEARHKSGMPSMGQHSDTTHSSKRKKKASTLKRGEKGDKDAMEEVPKSFSLPEQLNLADAGRPKKRTRLWKLLGGKEKKEEEDVTRDSTQTAQRATSLHGVITNLSIRPPVKANGAVESESRLFMSDVLEHFKRQKASRLCKTTSTLHKEMIQQALESTEKAYADEDPSLTAKVRTQSTVEIDRWWSEARFCGQAYICGVMFQQRVEDISAHLVLLEQKSLITQRETVDYIQQATGSSDINALENISPLSNFSKSQEVAAIGVGYSSTALVSRLGKVFIQAPVKEFSSCLGIPDCPTDWNGTLYLDTILGRRIASVSCGVSHFGAITDTNEVILWGVNTNYTTAQISGQLGNKIQRVCTPLMITGLGGTPKSIACGAAHTMILTTMGVYSCGANDHGQLGYESKRTVQPVMIPKLVDKFNVACVVSTIACGAFHSLVSTQDGQVFAWGLNKDGQLGLPHSNDIVFHRPVCVPSLTHIVTVAGGECHSIALNDGGQVFTFGGNLFGQLGQGPAKDKDWQPRMVSLGINTVTTFVVQISAGPFCSMALTNWGTGFTWGMLQSPLCIKHQFKPRMLTIPFQQNLFLVHLSAGVSHAVYMEDAELSRTLTFLQKVSRFEMPVDNKILTEQLQRIPAPEQTFGLLQERVAFNLRQNFTNPVPCISVSHSYITFNLSSLSRVNSTILRVRNPNDCRLLVKPIIPFNESKYQLFVEPASFVMNKRSSMEVTISLVTSRPLEEQIYRLIHLVTKRVSKNEAADSSLNQADSQYIIACSLVPAIQTTQQIDEPTDHVLDLIHSLSTYVPRVLKEYFMVNPNAPHEPKIQQFPAAILFLDISGFTSLNERLAELGSAGAEVVSKHINSYFSQLIEAVSSHGGDVLKFAGDALICMWKGEETLEVLTLRAVQCGLDIQSKLAKYDSNEGFSLTLHIGVGSGELFSLWVGSVDGSWEYLVSGEPLVQLRTAVDNSQTGQVVTSAPSWELIKHRCVGEPIGDDWWVQRIEQQIEQAALPPLTHWPRADAEPALRSFIPLAVQVSVDSQHRAGWQNELRTATVLFVKLNTPIPDHDKQEYLLTIHSVLRCMQRAIFKYDGMVRQFLADDKGTVLIAAFGLPPLSHIDDPVRGVKAALEMHQELSLLGMDCSIGVTTGCVFCGSVGSQVRQEYAMVGDTVNLSARLMIAAYKQEVNVLCDQATYDHAHHALHLDKLPAINVKGKKNLINIYHPSSEARHSVFQVPRRLDPTLRLTNRPAVATTIANLIKKVGDTSIKDKGTLLIEGEQGMGKTVVINELMTVAVQHNLPVCHAIADGVQSTSSFYVFKTIVADLLSITNIRQEFRMENYDSSAVRQKLEKLLDTTWYEMVPLLNDLLPLNFATNSVTTAMSTAHRPDYLSSLLRVIFEKMAGITPIVVAVEDAQYVDNYSRTLLRGIAEIPGVFLACSVRSYIGDEFVRIFSELSNLVIVKLPPLGQQESLAFVQSLLGVTNSLPSALVEVLSKAYGNPLLLSEITLGLKDASAISVSDDECRIIGDLNSINLTRVTRLLISTLDRFSAVQQMVLKVGM